MSRDKHHHKKKYRKDATNENENKNERPKSRLFTEVDAKSVEISGYTVGRGAPQTEQWLQGYAIPTGVVDVDESVQLPILPPKSHYQHHDSQPYTTLRPRENDHTEYVQVPPISHRSDHHSQHHPYEYVHPAPDYHYFEHLSHPYPVYHEHQPSHHHHQHRHRHHRHRHRHHHQSHDKHEKEVGTYDPRWWYMPVNSVHRPKPMQPLEQHYVPLKWYELLSTQRRTLTISSKSQPSPKKYADCRCQTCSPSKQTLRGVRWAVAE